MIYRANGLLTVPINMMFDSPEDMGDKDKIILIAEKLFNDAYKDKKIISISLDGSDKEPINYLECTFVEGELVNEDDEPKNSDEVGN